MIHKQIQEEIKEAMKSRDKVRLSVLRGLSAAFTNELVSKKRKPDGELTDEEALSVINRAGKQRKESIEQFRKGAREDLVKKEEQELAVIAEYLPSQMSKEEVEKIAKEKKEELGITDKSKMGMLMGTLMKELKGKADGAVVKEAVDKLFE